MKINKILAAVCVTSIVIGSCMSQTTAINLIENPQTGKTLSDFTNVNKIENRVDSEQYALDNQYKDCACSLSDEMREKYEKDNTLESRIEFMKSLSRPRGEALISADDEDETDLQNAKNLSDIKNKNSFLYQNCPTTGDVKALVFLVDFADMRNDDSGLTAEEVEKRLEGNSDAFPEWSKNPCNSVSGYYNTSSYGKLNIDFDVYGWYNSENNRSFYENPENRDDFSGNNLLIEEVMEYYDDSVDFSEYDANNDGLIDLVYFMYNGSDTGWGSQWWSYVTTFNFDNTYDEEGILKYCFVNLSGGAWAVNVAVIHETGHLLGLTDYYNYGTQTNSFDTATYIGSVDMMSANMGDHNIFSKMLLGWVEPVFVTENTSFDVLCSTKEDTKAYVIAPEFKNGVFGEYFIIEYYKSDNVINSYDGIYCPEGAVRIYHIDASLTDDCYYYLYSNDSDTENPIIMLMDSTGYDYAPLYGDELWAEQYYTEGMTLGINTAPSSELYDGIFSGINIHINKLSGDTARITVGFSDSDNESPKLRESRIPNVLGNALGVSGTQVFFTSNVYEGENINKVSIAPASAPSDKTYLDAAVKKYTASEKNCSSSIGIYSSYLLETDTEYILNIPAGTVKDSSGNPNKEINIPLTSVGGKGSYSDFELSDFLLLPEDCPKNAEVLTDRNKWLPLTNGNLICVQNIGTKTDEDDGYDDAGMVYKVFSPDKKLICNKHIDTAETWTIDYYDMYELETGNVLVMLGHEFFVFDGEGNIVNNDTYLPPDIEPMGWYADYFRRGDYFDVVDERYDIDGVYDTIIFVCRIGNDGSVIERFDLTEAVFDIVDFATPDSAAKIAKYYNEDYTIFNQRAHAYQMNNYLYSIYETKNDSNINNGAAGTGFNDLHYYTGNGVQYALNIICPRFVGKLVSIHDVKQTISKTSIDNAPMLDLTLSDYLGNTLGTGSCTVLKDNSILVTYPIWAYLAENKSYSTGNTFVIRMNSELEPLWSCVVPFDVIDASLYGDNILVLSDEKVYLFDDRNKTPILTHDNYNVSDEYDYDSEQGVIYTPQGKTAAQLRDAIEHDNSDITVYNDEGKIAEEGKTLTQAVVEVRPKNALYSVYYAFISDYQYLEIFDGTLFIVGYNGKSSDVVIPSEIDGKKVSGINSQAFWYLDSLVSVEIPQGIHLSEYTFCGCSSLTAVKISADVTFAEGEIFKDCSPNLTIYGYTNTQAEIYAEEFNVKFVPLDDSAKILMSSGTVVTVPEDSGADLGGKILNVSKTETSEDEVTYCVVLKDENNNEVQPGGTVEVKIPVPAGFDGEECYVYHKLANGYLTDMNAKYEGGCMVFTTDHFSEYVITAKKLETKGILGDINNDAKVTIADARMLLQAASGSRVLSEEQEAVADVNGDGKITVADARWLLQVASGSRVL